MNTFNHFLIAYSNSLLYSHFFLYKTSVIQVLYEKIYQRTILDGVVPLIITV